MTRKPILPSLGSCQFISTIPYASLAMMESNIVYETDNDFMTFLLDETRLYVADNVFLLRSEH